MKVRRISFAFFGSECRLTCVTGLRLLLAGTQKFRQKSKINAHDCSSARQKSAGMVQAAISFSGGFSGAKGACVGASRRRCRRLGILAEDPLCGQGLQGISRGRPDAVELGTILTDKGKNAAGHWISLPARVPFPGGRSRKELRARSAHFVGMYFRRASRVAGGSRRSTLKGIREAGAVAAHSLVQVAHCEERAGNRA